MIFNIISVAHAQEAATQGSQPGVAAMFGLSGKLFLAQLINFAIVLFVLWKWVFKPVTKGLQARTEKIENSLAQAKLIAEEKETFDSWKTGEISKVRKEASVILAEAKQEADNLKNETITKTKQEQERILEQTKTQIASEQEKAVEEVKTHVAELVASATEKVIRVKLNDARDKELIEEALKTVKV